MKLTINRLYGYKIFNKNNKKYTNSYYYAKFEQARLEKETKQKWIVRPTPKRECKQAWKDCPFNRLLGERYENKLTSER